MTPVDVIEVGRDRWLVAGYGPANWVLNTRAHGQVTLSPGRHSETYKVEEVGADATPNLSDEAVAAELSRHAVFRLIPSTPNRHANG